MRPSSLDPHRSTSVWRSILDDGLAREAVRAARDVATRLVVPDQVAVAAAAARLQTAFPRSTHWVPYTVSQGFAGLALLWSYLDACFPDEHWDRIGREHVELAARGAEVVTTPPVGLFSGLSGLAFAVSELSRGGTRYQRLLGALDEAICPQALSLAAGFADRRDGYTVGDFDLISGLSGVGAYLLCRRDRPNVSAALSAVTQALIEIVGQDEDLPRWHTPARLIWDQGMAEVYPHGNLNCGLAHGIPGPLALLAIAHRAGVSTPGMADAIETAADWLVEHRFDDDWGVNWPTAVPLREEHGPTGPILRQAEAHSSPEGPSRCAWCYGSPGVARALWLAGAALDRDDYRALAISSLEAVFRRPIPMRRIDSPTFCHGVAGLLQIALRFANDTGTSLFVEESRGLVRQLLAHHQPDSLLGFRNLEIADHEIDQPGLLDGAPGVALVLLAAATDVDPAWDRLFLLS